MTTQKSTSSILEKVSLMGILCVALTAMPLKTQAAIYSKEDLLVPDFSDFSDSDFTESFDDSSDLELSTGKYKGQFNNALLAFKEGRFEDTLIIARNLHEHYPDLVDPLKLMAATYMRIAKWDKAKIELEKVLELNPKEPSATRNLAIIEMQIGSTQRSRELLQSMLKENPGDKELTQLLNKVERYEEKRAAEAHTFDRATASDPQGMEARARLVAQQLNAGHYTKVLEMTEGLQNKQYRDQPVFLELRGKAQVLLGKYSAAQATFKQWTESAPQSADAYFYYGDSLLRGGDTEAAQQALERAVKLDSKHLLARVAEVKLLGLTHKIDEAQQKLAQLESDFADSGEVQSIAGWLALSRGEFSTAEKAFTKAFQKRPSSELLIQLVRAKWGLKKHGESIALMQDWLNKYPQDQVVLLYLAGAYTTLKQNKNAIAAYEKVNALNPDYVPVLNNLAWLNRDENLDKAMQYIEKALQLAPEDPYVLDTLGMITLKRGDIDQAYVLVKKAADQLPNDVQVHLHLSKILIYQKQYSQAEKILNAVIVQLPDSEFSDEARGLLAKIPENAL